MRRLPASPDRPRAETAVVARMAGFVPFLGLIVLLGGIFLASLSRAEEATSDLHADADHLDAPEPAQPEPAQIVLTYSGTMEPCLATHGSRTIYRAALQAMGWADVPDADRPAALDAIADAFLPVIGQIDGDWPAHAQNRARVRAFWEDLATNRTVMAREGQVLLLAGFANDQGQMVLECWAAGPENPATEAFFGIAGASYDRGGIRMTQMNIPASDTAPAVELFISRLTAPEDFAPPLAATDGLRTRVTFPMPETTQ